MKCPICQSEKNKLARIVQKVHILKKCLNCKFVFFEYNKDESQSDNTNYDEENILDLENQQTALDAIWFEKIANFLIKKSGKKQGKVLDVGCGTGLLLKAFKDRGWDTAGVDPSGWAEPYSKKFGFKLFKDKIENISEIENQYDIVVSTSVLEHIPDPLGFIQGCVKCMKKDAILYIAGVPNYSSLTKRLRLSWFKDNHPSHHINFFAINSMKYLLSKTNLSKTKVKTYGISGLYTLFTVLLSIFKRKQKTPNNNSNTPKVKEAPVPKRAQTSSTSEQSHINISKKEVGKFKKFFLKTFIFFYDKLRLPGCGDKLEVIAYK